MLLLNVRAVAGELALQRRTAPERVAEEEALLHPVPESGPANPWEEPAR